MKQEMSLSEMTVHEKICQTMVLNAFLVGELGRFGNPAEKIAECGGMENFLREYPIGGLFVGSEVISTDEADESETSRSIRSFFKACPYPLLFVSDLENGCGCMFKSLTEFPHMMALGACNDEALAYDYGRATALEARSVGIRWTFSPVADLNTNRFNPITNNRCIGDDPVKAARLLKAVVRGMQDGGLAAAAKHFPGDGDDYRDQHLVTTANGLPFDKWKQYHGGVFQQLIDDGLMSVMTGHIALPSYQQQKINGRFPPATLSHELTTGLLKKAMGFDGVVVTDALLMGGYLGWYERTQAQVESFIAGADMVLWPTFDYIEGMKVALESGALSMERLDDAVERIMRMKKRLGLFACEDPIIPMTQEDRAFVQEACRRTAEKSITLVQNRTGRIPLNAASDKRILMVGIMQDDAAYEKIELLREEIAARGVQVDMQRNILFDELEEKEKQYDRIVYVLYTRPHIPKGPLNFMGSAADSIWAALSSGAEKSIVVSLGSPYFAYEYFEGAEVMINAYSNSKATMCACAAALFGEIPFEGESPVSLR